MRSCGLDHALCTAARAARCAVKQARAVLVGNAQRVAKAPVVTSSVGSPLRSSRALVATVVPIFTHSTTRGDRLARLQAQQVADASHRRVAVLLGVVAEQLVGEQLHPAIGPGTRATTSVKVPPRSIQNCQRGGWVVVIEYEKFNVVANY
jgi:hypothetical protein